MNGRSQPARDPRDERERAPEPLSSAEAAEIERKIDEAVEESFPASDPPAWNPTHT